MHTHHHWHHCTQPLPLTDASCTLGAKHLMNGPLVCTDPRFNVLMQSLTSHTTIHFGHWTDDRAFGEDFARHEATSSAVACTSVRQSVPRLFGGVTWENSGDLGRKEGSEGGSESWRNEEIRTRGWAMRREREGLPSGWRWLPQQLHGSASCVSFCASSFVERISERINKCRCPVKEGENCQTALALHPPLPSTLAHFTE